MGEVIYRTEWLTGIMETQPPRYRVMRRTILVGWWPFRRAEYEYIAQGDWSTMTMSAEVYCWFKAQFGAQIDEEWRDG